MVGNESKSDAAPSDPVWRKSSRSGSNTENCVEIASHAGAVLVRDSKGDQEHVLRFPGRGWRLFLTGLAGG